LVTTDASQPDRYKTFGLRVWAALFDAGVVLPLGAVVALLCSLQKGPLSYVEYVAIYLVVSYGYSISTTYLLGGTLGKLAHGLRVVNAPNLEKITLAQSFLREMLNMILSLLNIALLVTLLRVEGPAAIRAYLVSKNHTWYSLISTYLSLALAVAELVTCLFSERRRAIHDIVAGTVVIKGKPTRLYFAVLSILLVVAGTVVSTLAFNVLKNSALQP
jgi:uncharacterized RDD family membrane protein YckC